MSVVPNEPVSVRLIVVAESAGVRDVGAGAAGADARTEAGCED